MNKIKKKKITFPYVYASIFGQSTKSKTSCGFRGFRGYFSQVLEITELFACPRPGYFVDFFVDVDLSVDSPFTRAPPNTFQNGNSSEIHDRSFWIWERPTFSAKKKIIDGVDNEC